MLTTVDTTSLWLHGMKEIEMQKLLLLQFDTLEMVSSVCVSICLYVYVSICLCVYMSVCLCVCVSMCLSVRV